MPRPPRPPVPPEHLDSPGWRRHLLDRLTQQDDVLAQISRQIDQGVAMLLARHDQVIQTLIQKGGEIMADLSALTAEVARNTDVDASAIALLQGLAAQIEQLKTDPAALQALADQLKGSSDQLAAAVTANTPAEPSP